MATYNFHNETGLTLESDGTYTVGNTFVWGSGASVSDQNSDGEFTSGEKLTYGLAEATYVGNYQGGIIISIYYSPYDDGDGNITPAHNDYYYLGDTPIPSNFTASNTSFDPATGQAVPCYVTGTRILTSRGEVAVEELQVGDLAVTASGEQRPIKWIGTRGYIGRFANANPEMLPICIKTGALEDGVPARDLWVSPKHALFLDDCLIPAEHLVNGTSIIKAERVDSVTYWHIELDSHDVLLAEGAPAESFVDDNGRGIFHNAHTYHALYADEPAREAVYCAPRIESGYTLQAVRRRLAERAGLPLSPLRDFGRLRGYVDGCDGRRVWGWAQSLAYPDAPVCLEVLVDGAVVGLASAENYRSDLVRVGIGKGYHGFSFRFAQPLSDLTACTVMVRRAADAATLGGLSWGEPEKRTVASGRA